MCTTTPRKRPRIHVLLIIAAHDDADSVACQVVPCRVHEAKARRRWAALVESVESAGGDVFIFSARHESGRQLLAFSGVAALLRFGMPELEEADPAELMAQLQIG